MNISRIVKKPLFILFALFLHVVTFDAYAQFNAEVTHHIFSKVKKNDNWKLAFLTAKDAQIVFMNISPKTNPKNEVGMEIHKFDQIIFVVEGSGKAILNGKTFLIGSEDLIFIPQGTQHNIINTDTKKPLKILSVYSSTDIPNHTIYPKKSNESHDHVKSE